MQTLSYFFLSLIDGWVFMGLWLGHDRFTKRPTVSFKNLNTGKIKMVPVGWSWWGFIAPGLFGIPLFMRKLYGWAFITTLPYLVYAVMDYRITLYKEEMSETVYYSMVGGNVLLNFIMLCVQLWLGKKMNALTAKSLSKKGWQLMDRDNEVVKKIALLWHL